MKSYSEDPGHYKALIAKINSEIDFSGHLLSQGYRVLKRSAGSTELEKDGERIVLQTKRSPVTYFNRSDSSDKGQFFKFLKYRSDNFYDAIRQGLESIQRTYEAEPPSVVRNPARKSRSLEERYHIGPLTRFDYLTHERGLDSGTLDSEAFVGRLFNAFHINADQSRIANIAVPKYGIEGTIKNYTLYNRPYTDKRDGKTKKFRLFLNERYEYLFTSNPDIRAEKIVCFESAFDALAYHELHGHPSCFYLSLSGHIDEKKLDQLFGWAQLVDSGDTLSLHLGFDHDMEGMRYDLTVLSSWLHRKSDQVYMEISWKRPIATIRLNYLSCSPDRMERDTQNLNKGISKVFNGFPEGTQKALCFKDKVIWEMNLEKIIGLGNDPLLSRAYWKTVVSALSKLYAGERLKMDKSPSRKDWNDELISVKKKCAP